MKTEYLIKIFGSAEKVAQAAIEFGCPKKTISGAIIAGWQGDVPLQWIVIFRDILESKLKVLNKEIEAARNVS